MNKKIGLIVASVVLLGSGGAAFADAVWDAADKACKGAGADCCAVADANGNPKKTNGMQHCACGLAIASAGPITNLRQRLKLTTAKGVRQSLAQVRLAPDNKAAIRN